MSEAAPYSSAWWSACRKAWPTGRPSKRPANWPSFCASSFLQPLLRTQRSVHLPNSPPCANYEPGVSNGSRLSRREFRKTLKAAIVARWRFAKSVKNRSVKTSFDVVGGAEVIASLIRSDDIVAIIEPTHPGERITRQFTSLVHAAFETAAGNPHSPTADRTRATGPIMAVAADPGDPTYASRWRSRRRCKSVCWFNALRRASFAKI